ncbi:hypothetical protein AcV5_009673 [Taiwanofungus camphoratus]|nr:hypothetical protein AcV5_009673 [Antrodia cinnamomea]
MLSVLPMHRAPIAASRGAPLSCRRVARTSGVRLQIATISAVAFPTEDGRPVADLKIADIFDAPRELGESSKRLALAASTRALSSRPAQSWSTPLVRGSPVTPVLSPPAPVFFEGPARPRHINALALRAAKSRSARTVLSTGSSGNCVTTAPYALPRPLPPPELFDGPSRLRPYMRGGYRGPSLRPQASAPLLILLGSLGAVSWFWRKQAERSTSKFIREPQYLA